MTQHDDRALEDSHNRLGVAQAHVSDKLGDVWWAFMLRGALAALLGIIALFWPTGSISLLLRIVGAFLIFDGVMVLFSFRSAGERETAFVQGVLTAAIGALVLIMPDTSIRMVFVLLGLWALVVGIGQLWTARKMDAQDSERGTAISLGAITSIAGVVFLLWPGTGVVAVAWIVAIAAFAIAAVLIWVAFRLKRVKERVDKI
jgi:uncharacterized membrane protein HdeD (DUF308 family)